MYIRGRNDFLALTAILREAELQVWLTRIEISVVASS